MNKQIIETMIGAIILLVAGYFFVMTYSKSGYKVGGENYVVQASFSDITGINSGSEVRISGVKIGTVQQMKLDSKSYQADISMLIDKSVKIPEDSAASIVGESLLGGKFIALNVGGAEKMLANGGKIEFTQPSVSLEQLLGKFVFSGGGVDGKNPSEANPEDDEIDLNLP
jgi:phospholipid/cholesterol/gamma-HCH transport system substrate-binding protein